MPNPTIRTINKNGRESIRVSVSEFKGSHFVDVRDFATGHEGDLKPTTKGVTVRPDLLRPTIMALLEAETRLIADGLLPREVTH